jgi:hypothetical protein
MDFVYGKLKILTNIVAKSALRSRSIYIIRVEVEELSTTKFCVFRHYHNNIARETSFSRHNHLSNSSAEKQLVILQSNTLRASFVTMRFSSTVFSFSMIAAASAEYFNEIKVRQ